MELEQQPRCLAEEMIWAYCDKFVVTPFHLGKLLGLEASDKPARIYEWMAGTQAMPGEYANRLLKLNLKWDSGERFNHLPFMDWTEQDALRRKKKIANVKDRPIPKVRRRDI